jgi:hypothetical protein
MSVDQLSTSTDRDLVHQALQLLTIDNVSGSVRLSDSSAVSMRDCIIEFAVNSKTREGRDIKAQLREKVGDLKAIVDVEKFKNKQNDDDADDLLDDNFSSIGMFDDADAASSSVKRKRLTTLAEAAVGKEHECADKTKRRIKPTNRLGTNVALKD